MRNATHPSVPLRFKPVKWEVVEEDGTVHTVTSFSAIYRWFVSHPEVDRDTLTLRRDGSVITQPLSPR